MRKLPLWVRSPSPDPWLERVNFIELFRTYASITLFGNVMGHIFMYRGIVAAYKVRNFSFSLIYNDASGKRWTVLCLDSFIVEIASILCPRKPNMCLTTTGIGDIREIKDPSLASAIVRNFKVDFMAAPFRYERTPVSLASQSDATDFCNSQLNIAASCALHIPSA